MRNRLNIIVSVLMLAASLLSCVSLQDRHVSEVEADEAEVVGTVQTKFRSVQFLFIQNKEKIKSKAYDRLLETAKSQYGNYVDIGNITIKGSFSGLQMFSLIGGAVGGLFAGAQIAKNSGASDGPQVALVIGGWAIGAAAGAALLNIQSITATGDVIALGPIDIENKALLSSAADLDRAISRASRSLIAELPNNSRIAVINVSSNNTNLSAIVVGELEFYLVSARKFVVVDRQTLDTVRSEQNFQLAGDVSDASAVSIGHMLGASIVITGSITELGTSQRLSLRALDVTTAQIITIARETF